MPPGDWAGKHPGQGEHSDGEGFSGLLADLTLAVGQLREKMAEPAKPQPRIPWSACHPVGPIGSLNLASGAGNSDASGQRAILGPNDPYWWDLRRLAVWGFTAGSVTVYKNGTAAQPGQQIGLLANPGNITWSAQELLAPTDDLILVASGITGNVQWELRAIEIETQWLPEYLL